MPFPPLFAHSDVAAKLREDLRSSAPWLLDSDPPARSLSSLTLGATLLGMAVGTESLRFVENLIAAGVDPFCHVGGRSLLHLACERAASGSALWLIDAARRAGRLPELLLSEDRHGRRPLDIIVDLGVDGPAFELLLGMEMDLPGPVSRQGRPRDAWEERALASSNDNVRRAVEWRMAQRVLGGGLLEERMRSGCPLAEVAEQLQRNNCMDRAMEDYYLGAKMTSLPEGAGTAAEEVPVLCRFIGDQVVRHARADVLRWMLLETDWQRWGYPFECSTTQTSPRFANRHMVEVAGAKWGLSPAELKAFQDVFDEVDGLLDIKKLVELHHGDFARAVVERRSVEAAQEACEAIEACAARVPAPLRQCALFQGNGEHTFADPAKERTPWGLHDDAHYPGAGDVMPLCYAAWHGLERLAMWLLERHDSGPATRIAAFRVAAAAAINGHLALAKV